MKHVHPRTDDAGQPVELKTPSRPTRLASWDDPGQIATVVPDGPMPTSLNGIDVVPWIVVPTDTAGWGKLATQQNEDFTEPPMTTAPGKFAASGVVILESDGRVWVVSPSNQYGGYVNTFPKGKLDPGMGLRANALKKALEESGLQAVHLVPRELLHSYVTHPNDQGVLQALAALG